MGGPARWCAGGLIVCAAAAATAESRAAGAQRPSDLSSRIPSLPITQLDDRARAADLDAPRPLSLAFSEPMPVADVLLLLFRGTPFSIVCAETSGSFAGELKDVTLRQALESVLFPASLDYMVHGTVVRVFPRRMETRVFELNVLNTRRTWERGVRSGVGPDGRAASANLRSEAGGDPLGDVGAAVAALLSQSGRSHVDRQAGLVHVTDFGDRLDQVGVYLEALHLRATRQVRLHARVFEVTLTAAPAIDWTALAGRAGSGLRSTSGAMAGLQVEDFAALMKAIGDLGAIRHIAAPQVLAMNNEPAVMRVGSQGVTFVSRSESSANGRAIARTVEPHATTEGLTLTIVPQIGADGIVHMSVSPTFAERTGEVRSSAGDRTPVLSVVETDTTVRVHGGETVLIAGLLRDRVQATPSTGLAGFFGAQQTTTAHAELVVLLTPTVVTPGGDSATGDR